MFTFKSTCPVGKRRTKLPNSLTIKSGEVVLGLGSVTYVLCSKYSSILEFFPPECQFHITTKISRMVANSETIKFKLNSILNGMKKLTRIADIAMNVYQMVNHVVYNLIADIFFFLTSRVKMNLKNFITLLLQIKYLNVLITSNSLPCFLAALLNN